ncbi:MAG: hypothetical protein AABX17_02275 [Nanoarchaeota archaeon]
MTKYLIFDSGPLINLTTNGLLDVFKELAEKFQGEFIITNSVKYETIEHPINIRRFEWGAIRIDHLLQDEIIRLPEDAELEINPKDLAKKTSEVMDLANNALIIDGKPLHLIEKGESETIALSLLLTEKGITNAVVIDERTARMMCEDAESLRRLMEEKLETKITMKEKNFEQFKKVKVIRSTELMFIANKKGLVDGNKESLEAVLYALKFGGCSISEKEVQMMKNL